MRPTISHSTPANHSTYIPNHRVETKDKFNNKLEKARATNK
jgi:hypothetical protein